MAGDKLPWACIVIGAGMSGLAAASMLAKAGHSVLVLEARPRIGGRIRTQRTGFPRPMDVGASFIHGTDGNPLTVMARTQGVKMHDMVDEHLMLPPDGHKLSPESMRRIEANVATAFFSHSREASRERMSPPTLPFGAWLLKPDSPLFHGLKTKEERNVARQFAGNLNGWTGADLDDVSFRYWGFEREMEGPDVVIDEYEALLKPLQRDVEDHQGKLFLEEIVNAIEFDEDAQLVHVTSTNATSGEAAKHVGQACICTVPLGVLQSPQHCPRFTPPLAPRRQASIAKLGFGLLNKIVLTYTSIWWPAHIGTFSIVQTLEVTDSGDESHRSLTLNKPNGPMDEEAGMRYLQQGSLWIQSYAPLSGHAILVCYFGGSSGEALEAISDEAASRWIRRLIAERIPRDADSLPADKPIPEATNCVITRWRGDPFSLGSYSYVPVAQGHESSDHPSPLDFVELSRPLWDGRLGFAGEHTEMDYYASVHGATISGWREANRVKAALEGSWASVRQDINENPT